MKRIDVETTLNESRTWLLANFEGLSPEQLRRPLTKSEHDPSNTWCALDHFAHLALVEQDFVRIIRRQPVSQIQWDCSPTTTVKSARESRS